ADCAATGSDRAHHQGSPAQGDGEDGRSVSCRACVNGGTDGRSASLLRRRLSELIAPVDITKRLRIIVPRDNRNDDARGLSKNIAGDCVARRVELRVISERSSGLREHYTCVAWRNVLRCPMGEERSRGLILSNRRLVFVVDDDPGILRGLKRLLREFGYDSLLFQSAKAFRDHDDF